MHRWMTGVLLGSALVGLAGCKGEDDSASSQEGIAGDDPASEEIPAAGEGEPAAGRSDADDGSTADGAEGDPASEPSEQAPSGPPASIGMGPAAPVPESDPPADISDTPPDDPATDDGEPTPPTPDENDGSGAIAGDVPADPERDAAGGAGGAAGAGSLSGAGGAGAERGTPTPGGGGGGAGANVEEPPRPGGVGGCVGEFILCEDFEATAVGDIPEGWSRRGEEVWVDEDEAYRGARSLKQGPIDSWERRISHEASGFGSAHWGRIFYKVELPVPDAFVHSTLLAFTGVGPDRGASEYRFIDTVKQAIDTPDVGSRHNFLFNVQPEDSGEFGRETSYDWEFDGQWHCAEYHVDASNQSYAFYLDGNEELSFEDGAGNYRDSDLPDTFGEVRVGWNNYQSAPPGFTVWIDEIAFAEQRIGCE
jgi:hypothetical protein